MNSPDFDNLDEELDANLEQGQIKKNDDSEFVFEDVSDTESTAKLDSSESLESLIQEGLESTLEPLDVGLPRRSLMEQALLEEADDTPLELTPEPISTGFATTAKSNEVRTSIDFGTSGDSEELAGLRSELEHSTASHAASLERIENLESKLKEESVKAEAAERGEQKAKRELDQAHSTINRMTAELEQIASERLIAERTNTLVSLGLESNLSFETATRFSSLGGDDFDTIVRLIRTATTSV
ncbi:MAG: hypothetical protein ACJZ8Y_11940 [Pirellulaceae bacterium]